MLARKEKYSLDEVLPFIGTDKKAPFGEDFINISSYRLRCFKVSGTSCRKCGIEGKFFAKEAVLPVGAKADENTKWHFNLYALALDGQEILMTCDHIIPKSRGGTSHIENLQTYCIICNSAKGNSIE